jgi:hypothetical protein
MFEVSFLVPADSMRDDGIRVASFSGPTLPGVPTVVAPLSRASRRRYEPLAPCGLEKPFP